jgi:hypothetical protein
MVGVCSACQSPSCSFFLRSCAVEMSSVSDRQMTQNCLNAFDELVAIVHFEGGFEH